MSRKKADPSDLELMLYADGELDGERLAAVEAFLARDVAARRKVRALDMAGSLVRERVDETASPADGIADLVMGAIAAEKSGAAKAPPAAPRPVTTKRAANDNARGIWAFAAIAAAAAAALLVWGRGATTQDVASKPSAGVAATAPHDSARPEAPKAADGPGVEVAAVDFGALTGALFYVATGAAEAETTTVVWISESAAGGDQ